MLKNAKIDRVRPGGIEKKRKTDFCVHLAESDGGYVLGRRFDHLMSLDVPAAELAQQRFRKFVP